MLISFHFQCLTPNMQSPTGDPTTGKVHGRLLGPPLGDQQQGSFSINLWKNAFQDALRRLCPVREGGHECGCLPVLARKVLLHFYLLAYHFLLVMALSLPLKFYFYFSYFYILLLAIFQVLT